MKKFLKIIVALFFAISIFGCEKDDICAGTTLTTPRLVIEFYDFTNPAVLKSVDNLAAIGNDQENGVVFNENAPDPTKYFISATSVALPLDISQDITTYKLRVRANSPNPAVYNDDIIKIDYTREQIYVSRACGYKTIFYLNNVTRTPIQDDAEWIRNITFEPTTIDNEQDIHVKIYW